MSGDALLIAGARLAGDEPVEIAIEDGVIAAVGPSVAAPTGAAVLDARGLLALPGGVDPHVHFNEPGHRSHWEGWRTGSAAAAAGGVTTVAEMPLNASPPTVDADAFAAKVAAASGTSMVDFALWGGVIPGNRRQLPPLAHAGVVGFKAFMSRSGVEDFPAADDLTLYEAMSTIAELELPLAVHAESDRITADLAERARAAGRTGVQDYLDSRPPVAETEAIARALELAAVTGCRLHVVHVSTARGVQLVAAARARGQDVTCEVTAHHLVLSERDALILGPTAKCAPPLRPPAESDALWDLLRNDETMFVVSDHSPAPADHKRHEDAFAVWGGIAGVQSTLELVLTEGVAAGRLAAATVPRALAGAAAARFGLTGKGSLAPGFDGDVTLVEVGPQRVLSGEELRDRHRLSPYVGRTLSARVRHTILRGTVMSRDDELVGPAHGRLIRPSTQKPSR